ncbi:hypothetical protein K440DRAFT_643938 [Wilcoxina mikolae CBS 423.85]|nr:hypothetical protein K440DRAFT_643938 [Wilcoxina mikolae CBS 423.85]
MATINERILEVLQFMKTCGFTSPSNFLRAMCESREPDIKQITGLMLGSHGVFSELVDKLFASHDAASIFQLTYESPMCQLALRVILKKLTNELNQIGGHRKVRHPASDFAEVDWESLNFERIGKAYRKAVPATSTHHLGLFSPIPPNKKKIMSVVVMSLLGFAWSQRANLLLVMSIWWISIEEIGHFTSHNVLAPLLESVRAYMPRISEAMVCETLWRFSSDYMTSTKRLGGVKLARFDTPEVYKLAAVIVDVSPMKAFVLDESSISGNLQILEAFVQELNVDKLKLGLNFLVPVSGDQLTAQRLRSLKYCLTYVDADSINKLQHLSFMNGDFYAADTLLRHITNALIIVAIMAHICVNSFEQMPERMVMDNWRDITVTVVKKCITPTIVDFNRKEKAPSEKDGLLENVVLLLQYGLIYRALGEAVAQGHSGGREGKWREMDRFNEQLVNYIKAIYNPQGTPESDHKQREVIACLIILFG